MTPARARLATALLALAALACGSVQPRRLEHASLPAYAPCGRHFCDAATSYCEIVLSDVPDPPTDYTCRPLPPGCNGAVPQGGCDCFPPGTRCRSFCGPVVTTSGRPGFHLTCRL